MSILVTGGAGYIGSHILLALIEAGEHVVVLDNLSTGNRWAAPSRVEFVEGEVGDRPLVERLLRARDVDCILHLAGSSIVPASVRNPLDYYENNACASRSLIQAAVAARVRSFVFSSSAAVYGAPDAAPVSEQAEARPISPYGRSKLMTEWMLADVANTGALSFVALRYFNVGGADPAMRAGQATAQATHLIKVCAEAAVGLRDRVEVFGTDYPTPDGTCVRDFIHVSDLADAHISAVRHLRGRGQSCVLNCGYGRGHSIRDVIAAVERYIERRLDVRDLPRRPGDAAICVADAALIRQVLDWRPRRDELSLIVRDAVEWERAMLRRSLADDQERRRMFA